MATRTTRLTPAASRGGPVDLIEPARVAALMRANGVVPTGCRLIRVRVVRVYPVRPATFGVEYELRLRTSRGRMVAGLVYAVPRGKQRAIRPCKLRVTPRGTLALSGLRREIPGLDWFFHTPDRDPSLPQVKQAIRLRTLAPRLASLPPFRKAAGAWRCEVLNYRPGRRCTLAYRRGVGPDAPFVVGKLHRKGPSDQTRSLLRELLRSLRAMPGEEGPRLPRLFAVWPDLNMIVLEGLSNAAAAARPRDRVEPLVGSEAAGRVLGWLHRAGCNGVPRFTPADELHATGRWVEVAGMLRRGTPTIDRIWRWLERRALRLRPARPCLLHRDFYYKQLLPTERGWAVVDLDTAARGDREQDVGNFIGHLIWDAVLSRVDAAARTRAVQTFLDGYARAASAQYGRRSADAASIDPARLAFYLVSSLLRVGIIHSLRTGTQSSAETLHDLAAAWIRPRRGLNATPWLRPAAGNTNGRRS